MRGVLLLLALSKRSKTPIHYTDEKTVHISDTLFASVKGSDYAGAIRFEHTSCDFLIESSLFNYCSTQYSIPSTHKYSASCFFVRANLAIVDKCCFLKCISTVTSAYGFQCTIAEVIDVDSKSEYTCFMGDDVYVNVNAPNFAHVANRYQNFTHFNLYEMGCMIINEPDTTKNSINVYNVASYIYNTAYGAHVIPSHSYKTSYINFVKVEAKTRGIIDYQAATRTFSHINFYGCTGRLFSMWPNAGGLISLEPVPILSDCFSDSPSALLSHVTLSGGLAVPDRTNTHDCWPASFMFSRHRSALARQTIVHALSAFALMV